MCHLRAYQEVGDKQLRGCYVGLAVNLWNKQYLGLCGVRMQAFERDPVAVYFSRAPSYNLALSRAQFRLILRGLPRATHFYATASLTGALLAMQYPQQQVYHTTHERPPSYMCVYHLRKRPSV